MILMIIPIEKRTGMDIELLKSDDALEGSTKGSIISYMEHSVDLIQKSSSKHD
jgi:hypothetical protein